MDFDATVVGSGPNGLAAAIEFARAGRSVCVFEGNDSIGGGVRSAELTLPSFVHDLCSAIHPLAVASPFFRTLPLADLGLKWIEPDAALAHPLPGGPSIVVERGVAETARALAMDASAYRQLFETFVRRGESLLEDILAPVHIPANPLLMARFGLEAVRSAYSLVNERFRERPARALFAGMAAHSSLPLEQRPSAAFGLVMTILAHAVGWPFPMGGSGEITKALAAYLRSLGGRIFTGVTVRSLDELPRSRFVFLDLTPRQFLKIAATRLNGRYRHRLESYRYGAGVFKMDWALSSPVPWRDAKCRRAATVHLGESFEAIAASEQDVYAGRHAEKPFVILAQPSVFDSTRAPAGKQTAWAYCHVPNGSNVDMTERIEAQIEEVAPGFRDCILARHTMTTRELESYNPNYIGGDINGGLQDLRQMIARPVLSASPYRTPIKGVYLCSSSTPPGGGVHGMCGFHAARTALADGRSGNEIAAVNT
jgi:phytoene dehydrogenase-like protein